MQNPVALFFAATLPFFSMMGLLLLLTADIF